MAYRVAFQEMTQSDLEFNVLQVLPRASLGMTMYDVCEALKGMFIVTDFNELGRMLSYLLQNNSVIKDESERYRYRWLK